MASHEEKASYSTSLQNSYKWALSLRDLLNDEDGVKLLSAFIDFENQVQSQPNLYFSNNFLMFWFACEGLKQDSLSSFNKASLSEIIVIAKRSKAIYRSFLKSNNSNLIPISVECKKKIREKLNNYSTLLYSSAPSSNNFEIDTSIFDEAQKQVEDFLAKSIYPLFLQSDIYLNHLQMLQEEKGNEEISNFSDSFSPKSFETSSIASSTQNYLPTLPEEDEFEGSFNDPSKLCYISENSSVFCSESFSQNVTKSDIFSNSKISNNEVALKNKFLNKNFDYISRVIPNTLNPYHSPYAPYVLPSTQDTEVQSMSSGAFSEDTVSNFDNKSLKKINQSNNSKLVTNPSQRPYKVNNQFDYLAYIPKHRNPPTKMPPSDPDEFARVLIEKLNKFKKEQDDSFKFDEAMKRLQDEDTSKNSASNNLYNMNIVEEGQSILDDHIHRVWQEDSCNSNMCNLHRYKILTDHHGVDKCSNHLQKLNIKSFNPNNSQSNQTKFGNNRLVHNKHSCVKGTDEFNTNVSGYRRNKFFTKFNVHRERFKVDSLNNVSNSDYGTDDSASSMMYLSSECREMSDDSLYNSHDLSKPQNSINNKNTHCFSSSCNKCKYRSDSAIPSKKGNTNSNGEAVNKVGMGAGIIKRASSTSSGVSSICTSNAAPNYVPQKPSPDLPYTVIGYFFCNQDVPYRTKIVGKNITLKHFKSLLAKKGKYRYFFKTHSDEFDTGAIHEEISDDDAILPLWEGKIFAKVESID